MKIPLANVVEFAFVCCLSRRHCDGDRLAIDLFLAHDMHHPPNPPILYSFPSASDLGPALAAFIAKAQKESVEKKGRFTVALSGGSLPKQLKGLIGNPAIKWDKW